MGDAVSQTVARPPTTSSLQKSRTQMSSPISLLGLLRAALVVLAAALSTVVLPRVGSLGPDLVLLVVVAAGLLGGPTRGALVGLGAGWVVDLMPPAAATLGVAALTYATPRVAAAGGM